MLTSEQIEFLNRVCPNRWAEKNNIIDVKGDVYISAMHLNLIPMQFGKVDGYFDCSKNKLTTLKGVPCIITRSFNCDSNQLTSLEDGPKEVGGYYSCARNQLTSLIDAPEICNFNFNCYHNQLTSLEGCPKVIKGSLLCENNPDLKILWGIGHVEGKVHYNIHNEINQWIIECARKDIIFPHFTLEENINWIKREQKYSSLLSAPEEIRQNFAPRILNLVDLGAYNESRILDYKKFKKLC